MNRAQPASAPREFDSARLRIIAAKPTVTREGFAQAVRTGLCAPAKSLPCAWFYDHEGSLLFEEISALPEYYLTRAEEEILARYAGEIVNDLPRSVDLVELGSGSAAKTRILIQALLARDRALRYVPIDISETMLEASSRALLAEYEGLSVCAIAAEYEQGLRVLREEVRGPRLVLWLGSNVGNFERAEAAEFLGRVRDSLSAQDRLLIGIDLRKSAEVLERAYDDASGVTKRFNLNLLARINRELGGHFDLSRFRHRARYDAERGRIEMYLDSLVSQRVRIDKLGLEIALRAGEPIHTENSYKYSPAEIDELARTAGFAVESTWLDRQRRFSVHRFAPVERAARKGPFAEE
jgi:dimethylhistidine N-methyltransferase